MMKFTMKAFMNLPFIAHFMEDGIETVPDRTIARLDRQDFRHAYEYADGRWHSLRVSFIEDPALTVAKLPR
ncbi:MAG: hypothetical protein EOO77_11045 [Oxalobacteraceae bacterium]|nr:MAG: hypothetical protein EOO77_11045 [Oxalobacteraceae bacterium]